MSAHSPLKNYSPEKVDNMDYSCSAFLIYAGINRQLRDKLHVHNVVFAKEFRGNIDDIFSGKMPNDPSLYLYFPSVEDEALVPKDQRGMYVLMPVSELKTGEINWNDPSMVEQAKDVIYNKLETIEALKDIRQDIVSETVFTPLDFESRYNAKSVQHSDLCQYLHKVIIIDTQMYQEIIKTYTLQEQVCTLVQVCQLC